MNVTSERDRATILEAATNLKRGIDEVNVDRLESVEEWLKAIDLEIYAETFEKHLYKDMDRVRRVWEVELAAVLEIQKIGHRWRILASVNGLDQRNEPLQKYASLVRFFIEFSF